MIEHMRLLYLSIYMPQANNIFQAEDISTRIEPSAEQYAKLYTCTTPQACNAPPANGEDAVGGSSNLRVGKNSMGVRSVHGACPHVRSAVADLQDRVAVD
jgi:hypothetical protein